MSLSIFDMFSIGIGPSSSHTVGPMRAVRRFLVELRDQGLLPRTRRLSLELFGSLGHTGKGHGTDHALFMGAMGEEPETVDTEQVVARAERIAAEERLDLLCEHTIPFSPSRDVIFHRRKNLTAHPNGMIFKSLDENGEALATKTYYSIGGGFVIEESELKENEEPDPDVPHPFTTGEELLHMSRERGLSISTMMLDNERSWRSDDDIRDALDTIWETMKACVDRGCHKEGVLPGALRVPRRAAGLYRRLKSDPRGDGDPLLAMDWVNLFALAVNEENAAGGRVVTAPTNGAAGILPAVLHYYERFTAGPDRDGIHRFLLAAGAIGIIYKKNASISGAEVGCQGEVGVACSMAAAGLTEVMGGTPPQVENAAEIGMEHNLGLTCDPVGGLVQVPCIERNAMGAIKAINACRLALRGDGNQKVSLDRVIETMRQTGADMKTKYKETARGGLAVNIVEC